MVMRFFAGLFLLIAAIALIADATPPLSGTGSFVPTSFVTHLNQIAPATLKTSEAAITRTLGAWGWSLMVAPLIALPTFVLFGLLALITGYAGRHRRRTNVYAN